MSVLTRLLVLANNLHDAGLNSQAETILIQALQLTEIKDVRVISPNDPIYQTVHRLLRPQDTIATKLDDFNRRLTLE